MPDNFRTEHSIAKNTIQQAANVVRGVRVALQEQRAGRFQDATELFQARPQELDILIARFPLVAKLKLRRAVAREKRVHLLREKRRVNINQVRRLAG